MKTLSLDVIQRTAHPKHQLFGGLVGFPFEISSLFASFTVHLLSFVLCFRTRSPSLPVARGCSRTSRSFSASCLISVCSDVALVSDLNDVKPEVIQSSFAKYGA